MDVKLFKFSKRENSTKRPTGGTTFQCYLKEPTSVVNPTIVIETSGNAFPDYNYGYISTFGRYYFVTDIVSDGYMWEISMQTDILATYKSQISSASLYLLRCSSAYDGNIVDSFYPVSTKYTTRKISAQSPWSITAENPDINISNGTFIVGIVADPGGTVGNIGSVNYHAMTRSQLNKLLSVLMDDDFYTATIPPYLDTSDASIQLQKAIIDPLSFIKSCVWIPIQYSTLSSSNGFAAESSALDVWSWTLAVHGGIDYSVKHKTMTSTKPYMNITGTSLTLDAHPQAATRGSFMNCEPYTRMAAFIPPFGFFDLDTTKLKSSTYLKYEIIVDFLEGNGILNLTDDNGVVIARYQSQVGVPVQLSQVTRDYIGGAVSTGQNIVNSVASLFTGNIAGAINNGLSAIGSASELMKPIVSSIGSNGSYSSLYGLPTLFQHFYEAVPDDNANIGRPLCQNKTISTLSSGSFLMAREGDVAISGTAGEQAALKAFLEGGIFYE